jgi:transposase
MTTMTCSHLGIDVSKLKLDVALLTAAGLHTACFENSLQGFGALERWLAGFANPVRVCLEATGTYGLGVARFLYQQKRTVSIVNPLMIHHFARARLSRNKTDAHDAELIARFSQQNNPRPWQPPSPEQEKLQTLVRVREQLVESRALAKQHLEGAPRAAAAFFNAQIRQLTGQIDKIENQIRQAWQDVPELAQAMGWLTSIPGVGEVTAVTILAILPPLDQIQSARQLAAFAGVTPCQKQSGKNTGKTRMSKLGHSRLRKALYLPAVVAVRYNPRAQALAQRLAAKGKPKMVIIGAVMRLLTHLIFGVLKNRTPFDPNYLTAQIASKAAAGRL